MRITVKLVMVATNSVSGKTFRQRQRHQLQEGDGEYLKPLTSVFALLSGFFFNFWDTYKVIFDSRYLWRGQIKLGLAQSNRVTLITVVMT